MSSKLDSGPQLKSSNECVKHRNWNNTNSLLDSDSENLDSVKNNVSKEKGVPPFICWAIQNHSVNLQDLSRKLKERNQDIKLDMDSRWNNSLENTAFTRESGSFSIPHACINGRNGIQPAGYLEELEVIEGPDTLKQNGKGYSSSDNIHGDVSRTVAIKEIGLVNKIFDSTLDCKLLMDKNGMHYPHKHYNQYARQSQKSRSKKEERSLQGGGSGSGIHLGHKKTNRSHYSVDDNLWGPEARVGIGDGLYKGVQNILKFLPFLRPKIGGRCMHRVNLYTSK